MSEFILNIFFILFNKLGCYISHLLGKRKQHNTYDQIKAQMKIGYVTSVYCFFKKWDSHGIVDKIDHYSKNDRTDYIKEKVT